VQLEGLLGRLNGFLIPGGAANLRPGHNFYDTAKRVLDYALRANDRGEHFPLMGICLGFETLMILTAGLSMPETGAALADLLRQTDRQTGRDVLDALPAISYLHCVIAACQS
jgi:gamma-glutamyl hydrolase